MPQDGINMYMSLIDKVSSPLDDIGKKTKVFSKDMDEMKETLGRWIGWRIWLERTGPFAHSAAGVVPG